MTSWGSGSNAARQGEVTGESAPDERRVPADQRAALIRGITEARSQLESAARSAELLRTLPEECVQILRDLGAFWWKTPAELGGSPLDPLTFSDMIEELAYCDASAGWAAMIGAGSTGIGARWLPDEGVEEVFRGGDTLPVLAGQPQPKGVGHEVEGGYRVSGRWSFASGIHHANWLLGAFRVAGGDPEAAVSFVVPKAEAEVLDTWHVAGLQGTGSSDFAIADVFIPRSRTYRRGDPGPERGGALYRQDPLAFVGNELPPLCVGVTRRAIDDAVELLSGTTRGLSGVALADRPAFQRELGTAEARLRAASLLYRDAIEAAWEAAIRREKPSPRVALAVGTAQTYVVDECAEVISGLFRYGGGRVLELDHPLQRHLRNVLAARQHGAATEEHYERAGQERLQREPVATPG